MKNSNLIKFPLILRTMSSSMEMDVDGVEKQEAGCDMMEGGRIGR